MYRILVIDDEAPLRQLIISALRARGYQGIEADNGQMGVQLANQHLPDLILCDVMMPKMDGFATLEAMRAQPATALIPFVLMTGRPDNAGMRHGMTLGADDYLPKPFSLEELFATVETRLKKQKILREEAEKKLADLRSNISMAMPHELFTPLSGIIGFADILVSDAATLPAEEVAEIGKAISLSGDRLYRIIENYLIYAQIEILAADPQKLAALNQSLTNESFQIIHDEANQQAQRAERAGDLRLDLAGGSVAILEEYLKKIANELISNAFKFSEKGTHVQVTTTTTRDQFVLTVIDQGRGMNAEQLARVGAYMQFERKVYEQQGSGLGLAIAKRLTEIHKGALDIKSVQGQGTTVKVTLPSSITIG